jgi:hypothetical protein
MEFALHSQFHGSAKDFYGHFHDSNEYSRGLKKCQCL